MEKKNLLTFLKKSADLEDKYVEFFSRFFLKKFDWGGIEPERIERAKKILEHLRSDTKKHRKILTDMAEMIEIGDRDEF